MSNHVEILDKKKSEKKKEILNKEKSRATFIYYTYYECNQFYTAESSILAAGDLRGFLYPNLYTS